MLRRAFTRRFCQWTPLVKGVPGTDGFRVFVTKDSKPVSSWNDVPLIAKQQGENSFSVNTVFNYVNEIPRHTVDKMEIDTSGDPYHPIKQDLTDDGEIRSFMAGKIPFNYGCFPQTWEDPTFVHPDAEGCRGDNDPVDVCEIGARIVGPGVSDR